MLFFFPRADTRQSTTLILENIFKRKFQFFYIRECIEYLQLGMSNLLVFLFKVYFPSKTLTKFSCWKWVFKYQILEIFGSRPIETINKNSFSILTFWLKWCLKYEIFYIKEKRSVTAKEMDSTWVYVNEMLNANGTTPQKTLTILFM